MADDELDSVKRYHVVPQGKGWEVVADRRHIAWFASQAHALQQAISWADEDATAGNSAQVFLETGTDEARIVWSSFERAPKPR